MDVLRVHFAAGDLAATRIAGSADPLWETALSLHRLREARGGPEQPLWARRPGPDGWRDRAVRQAAGPLRVLLALVPPRGYFPDFLTPPAGSAGVEPGLEALMATPRHRLRTELALLARKNTLPPWARSIADGEPAALRALARCLRTYHHTVIGPSWPSVGRCAEHDRALRLHALRSGGAEALLRSFGPVMRWRPPWLEVSYPLERELRLEGRGLTLVPSYFCRAPIALADVRLPPVLVYPAAGFGTEEVRDAATGSEARDDEGPRFRTYGTGALQGVRRMGRVRTGLRSGA